MLRLIGGGAIMLASAMTAQYISSGEKKKLDHLESVIRLVRHIRDQIDSYSMPMEKILASGRDILLRLGTENEERDLRRLLYACGEGCGEECKKTLDTFAGALGRGYREQQVRLCDATLAELEDIRKKLSAAYSTKKKTASALCYAAGGALLIALL